MSLLTGYGLPLTVKMVFLSLRAQICHLCATGFVFVHPSVLYGIFSHRVAGGRYAWPSVWSRYVFAWRFHPFAIISLSVHSFFSRARLWGTTIAHITQLCHHPSAICLYVRPLALGKGMYPLQLLSYHFLTADSLRHHFCSIALWCTVQHSWHHLVEVSLSVRVVLFLADRAFSTLQRGFRVGMLIYTRYFVEPHAFL